MQNANLLNALRKLWNLVGVRYGVGEISSAGVGPIIHFHYDINASVYKELPRLHTLPHIRKALVETQHLCRITCLATCVKFSWRRKNSCYEGATIKHRYESYRECMENHSRESSEQKSSKFGWFLEFSERRMGKYH